MQEDAGVEANEGKQTSQVVTRPWQKSVAALGGMGRGSATPIGIAVKKGQSVFLARTKPVGAYDSFHPPRHTQHAPGPAGRNISR